MRPVQIDFYGKIHAPLAAEGTAYSDRLSGDAIGSGGDIARASLAADDRGFARRNGWHGLSIGE
jgi:hypothetical protein